MWKGASFLGAVLLAGCVAKTDAPPTQTAQSCPLAQYRPHIGLPVETVVFPLTLEHRVIEQGAAVTMDHLPDRLNVHLDKAKNIERLSCG